MRADDGALLSPSAFLYVAERFGLIQAIDCWVARQAIALIASARQAGRSLTLHVNLSGKSIGIPQSPRSSRERSATPASIRRASSSS